MAQKQWAYGGPSILRDYRSYRVSLGTEISSYHFIHLYWVLSIWASRDANG